MFSVVSFISHQDCIAGRAGQFKNKSAKYTDSAKDGAREMEFNLLDGRDDGEDSGVGFMEISKIFVMNGAFLLELGSWMEFTNRICLHHCISFLSITPSSSCPPLSFTLHLNPL